MGLLRKKSDENHRKILLKSYLPIFCVSILGLLRKKYAVFNVVKSDENHFKNFLNPRYRFLRLLFLWDCFARNLMKIIVKSF